jgi:hypothetical protein
MKFKLNKTMIPYQKTISIKNLSGYTMPQDITYIYNFLTYLFK